jgi:hypothetical protein
VPDARVMHATQRRAQCVGQVLLGYLEVPAALDQQLSFVVNPPSQARHEERVWNAGDQRTKLVSWLHLGYASSSS